MLMIALGLTSNQRPAYAAWLSWYFLGETLDLQGWVGSGLILTAVVIGAMGTAALPPPMKPVEA